MWSVKELHPNGSNPNPLLIHNLWVHFICSMLFEPRICLQCFHRYFFLISSRRLELASFQITEHDMSISLMIGFIILNCVNKKRKYCAKIFGINFALYYIIIRVPIVLQNTLFAVALYIKRQLLCSAIDNTFDSCQIRNPFFVVNWVYLRD